MLFHSPLFLFCFLPIVLTLFFLLGRFISHSIALAWLLLASFCFYAWWEKQGLWVILFSLGFNYSFGWLITKKSKKVLVFGVVLNVFLLIYFKCLAAFYRTGGGLFQGAQFSTEEMIIIPLAISFFTFQQITYLVSCYRTQTFEKNFFQYALFVLFFPQLITGPIVHHEEVIPTFKDPLSSRLNFNNISCGVVILTIGLFKKVVLADNLALYADPVFAAAQVGDVLTFLEVWGGLVSYTFQIYFDFSGYSDMAIGIALLFNVNLPVNFRSPFLAVNRFDYWRRWHITFGRFMRVHVFRPLMKNSWFCLNPFLALVVTVFVSALWHGVGWTFLFWGFLQGVTLFFNHLFRRWRRSCGHDLSRPTRWGTALSISFCFFVTLVLGLFFRSESLTSAFYLLSICFGLKGMTLPTNYAHYLSFFGFSKWLSQLGVQFQQTPLYYGKFQVLFLVSMLAFVWLLPNTERFVSSGGQGGGAIAEKLTFRKSRVSALFFALLFGALILFLGFVQRFIYYQF